MTVRIYAALTIALACSVGGCSTSPGVTGAQASASQAGVSSESAAKLALGKGNGEGSADVTGSIPPKETSKETSKEISKSSSARGSRAAAAKFRANGQESHSPQQQRMTEEAPFPDQSSTAARKLDEPLYRPIAARASQAQQPSAGGASNDPANAMALASAGAMPARQMVTGSIQPTQNRLDSISLSYPTDAVDLSEKDRRNVIGFLARRGPADRITVVTGPSIAANPLEGLLRVQERGRRLGELLATHGPVEVRFEPDLPRDSVRID